MKYLQTILKNLKKIERKSGLLTSVPAQSDYEGQSAGDLVHAKLTANEPCMIARYGANELSAVVCHVAMCSEKGIFRKCIDYFADDISEFWIDNALANRMKKGAGFFPSTPLHLARFAELMLMDSGLVDILGSWLLEERYIAEYFKQAQTVRLRDLEPYYHAKPWTVALAGKKVLVVHPFSMTIVSQYEKRVELFPKKDILPEFELLTYAPVQSMASVEVPEFETWFDALEKMKTDIGALDFDIAIIGAGAYGFPLAAHIKRIGKKAVHLGGATQILFGIKGSRWEQRSFFQSLFNEHWVYPSADERPRGYKEVENGCYW